MAKLVLIEAAHPLDEEAHYISLGYLAAYVFKYYGDVDVRVLRSTGDLPVSIEEGDIVGISAFTQNYGSALRIAESVKKANSSVPVVVGGNHITFLPESLGENMDIAVLGEGEQTFLEIVKLFFDKKFDRSLLKGISGIAYWEDKKIVRTPQMPRAKDLDSIPRPARHLTHTGKKYDRVEMITSRGCPFKCVYCASSALWGQQVRFHSVEYVTAELDHIIETYDPSWVNFVDDLFVARKDRVRAIMDHIRSKGYNEKITFYFTAHATMVDDELCELLKDVKCRIGMGIETGSDKILKQIKTGAVSVAKNQAAIETLSKHDNITIGCAFLVGLPDETLEDMNMTYEFIVNSKMDGGAVSIVTPYPGTYLWDYALERGMVSVDMDWESMRFNAKGSLKGKVVINTTVTREELDAMFHKINSAIYHIYVRNGNLLELFSHARLTIPFVIKNFFASPRKYIEFAKAFLHVKFENLLGRKKK